MEKLPALKLLVALAVGMRVLVGLMLAAKSLGLQLIGHNHRASPRLKERWMCNPTMYPDTGHKRFSVNSTNTIILH